MDGENSPLLPPRKDVPKYGEEDEDLCRLSKRNGTILKNKIPHPIAFIGSGNQKVDGESFIYDKLIELEKLKVFVVLNQIDRDLEGRLNLTLFFCMICCCFCVPVIGVLLACLCFCCLFSRFSKYVRRTEENDLCMTYDIMVVLFDKDLPDDSEAFGRMFVRTRFPGDSLCFEEQALGLFYLFLASTPDVTFEKAKNLLCLPPLEMASECSFHVSIDQIIDRIEVNVAVNRVLSSAAIFDSSPRLDVREGIGEYHIPKVRKDSYSVVDFFLTVVARKVGDLIEKTKFEESLFICNRMIDYSMNKKFSVDEGSVLQGPLSNPKILLIRATIYELMGELERAIEDYSEYIELTKLIKKEITKIGSSVRGINPEPYISAARLAQVRVNVLYQTLKTENYCQHIHDIVKRDELAFQKIYEISESAYRRALAIAMEKETSNSVQSVQLSEVRFGERNFSTSDECELKVKRLRKQLKNTLIGEFDFLRRLGKKQNTKVYFGCDADIFLCRRKKYQDLLVVKILRNYNLFQKKNTMVSYLHEVARSEKVNISYHQNVISILWSGIGDVDYQLIHKVSVLDSVITGVNPFTSVFVMRYFPTNLENFTRAKRSSGSDISRSEFLQISIQILKGVAHIKKNRICHRDIKPANIFIDPEFGKVVIGDFGHSTKFQSTKFRMKYESGSDIGGSQHYLPPEITDLEGKKVLCYSKSDIFSVGVVLYFLLSDVDPFGGVESRKRKDCDYVDLDGKTIDQDVCEFVVRLLRVNPDDRISIESAVQQCEMLSKKTQQ